MDSINILPFQSKTFEINPDINPENPEVEVTMHNQSDFPFLLMEKTAYTDRARGAITLTNLSNDFVSIPPSTHIANVISDDIPVHNKKLPDNRLDNYQNYPSSLLEILSKYKEQINFYKPSIPMPTVNLNTGEHAPIFTPPYRTTIEKGKIINEQVSKCLDEGILEKSRSPWSSPVILVPKKSENNTQSYRLCCNFINLNKLLVRRQYPLPRPVDIAHRLKGSRVFSRIDLKNAYLQFKINKEDRCKTSIITEKGTY